MTENNNLGKYLLKYNIYKYYKNIRNLSFLNV